MRLVGASNWFISATEPFKLKADDQRERLGTGLHALPQAVTDRNTLTAQSLPPATNRIHTIMVAAHDLVRTSLWTRLARLACVFTQQQVTPECGDDFGVQARRIRAHA